MIDQQVVSWYSSPLTKNDETFLGLRIGDKTQQTAECLNLLVALRNWKEHWTTERVCLEGRADNITALTMVVTLKGSSPAVNQIARELALDLGDASFRPDVITHTPGVASCIADTLSRRYEPGAIFIMPPQLKGVSEYKIADRDST